MARSIPAVVKAEMLIWARESLGLPPELAAKRLGVSVDRLREWETERRPITIAKLRKASEVYKRPLAAFFLPRPPREPEQISDFRTLPHEDDPGEIAELRL